MENSSLTTKLNAETIGENSGQTKSDLPEEIVLDIFSRLQVKPVFHLQCLSKKFLSITYDQSFIHTHLKQSTHLRPSIIVNQHSIMDNQQLNFFMIQYNGLDSKITVENLPTPYNMIWPNSKCKIETAGSCNGLVVLIVDNEYCFIWNPATMQCVGLPHFSKVPYEYYVPMESWGFGYSAESKVYKIVRIRAMFPWDLRLDFKCLVEVFTYGKDRAWRSLDFNKFEDSFKCNNRDGITVKGVVYWIINGNVDKLLSFDLEKEKFAPIFCPAPLDGKIMEFRGSLALCARSPINGNSFDLWVLKDEEIYDVLSKNSWEKIYTIDEIYPRKPIRCLNDHQLFLLKDTETTYEEYSCSLYDLESKEIREIPEVLVCREHQVHNFVESIVPLFAQGEGPEYNSNKDKQ